MVLRGRLLHDGQIHAELRVSDYVNRLPDSEVA